MWQSYAGYGKRLGTFRQVAQLLYSIFIWISRIFTAVKKMFNAYVAHITRHSLFHPSCYYKILNQGRLDRLFNFYILFLFEYLEYLQPCKKMFKEYVAHISLHSPFFYMERLF